MTGFRRRGEGIIFCRTVPQLDVPHVARVGLPHLARHQVPDADVDLHHLVPFLGLVTQPERDGVPQHEEENAEQRHHQGPRGRLCHAPHCHEASVVLFVCSLKHLGHIKMAGLPY